MTHALQSLRPWRALSALIAATALAVGCGGGSESGVGGGGTGSPQSFSRGPISGFGSIIVNDVHFDDSGASVTDDDGNALSGAQSLRLGTVVDVEGGAVSNGATAASAIRVHVDLVGPVTAAYDATSGRLAVLGQPVRVVSTTALDGFHGGAAAIAAGSTVAVSSLYDQATGVYVATRIDPAPAATRFAIRGAPSAVDTTADTFTIGGVVFSYGSLAPPSPFAAGQLLRAVLAVTPDSQGRWVVTAFGQAQSALPEGRSGGVNGVVDSVADAGHFVVGGVAVDASSAKVTPAGATIGVQARVVVQGIVTGGVLVATAVHVRAHHDSDDDSGNGNDAVELDGAILTLDAASQTFTMRGPTTVAYAAASFAGGKATDLAVGAMIRVQGNLSASGAQVIADKITFSH
ncbi:MAG TPA: DUF5666 domain-containing protein [Burkholderiaceae bacterium]|jgi:hypothetical protein|nr:DUF5666 domain-containing protein [Burkholderiaceae bacterium]